MARTDEIRKPFYFEAHITIDPLPTEEAFHDLKAWALSQEWRVSDLYLRSGEAHRSDAFLSARDPDYDELYKSGRRVIAGLRRRGQTVRRFKIESVIYDTRKQTHKLLVDIDGTYPARNLSGKHWPLKAKVKAGTDVVLLQQQQYPAGGFWVAEAKTEDENHPQGGEYLQFGVYRTELDPIPV